MMTFLPYPEFIASAQCLDRQRLGKQRVEAWQILRALLGETSGWRNHPAVRMWSGCEAQLCLYSIECCNEWIKRGYEDNLRKQLQGSYKMIECLADRVPSWLGSEAFHASHRSNLLRKDPVHYGRFSWTEPDDLLYVWPEGR
jgi:hypothetical protein